MATEPEKKMEEDASPFQNLEQDDNQEPESTSPPAVDITPLSTEYNTYNIQTCWNYRDTKRHWGGKANERQAMLLNNFWSNAVSSKDNDFISPESANELMPPVYMYFKRENGQIGYIKSTREVNYMTDDEFGKHFPFKYTDGSDIKIKCETLMQCKFDGTEDVASMLMSCIYVYVVYNRDPDSTDGYKLQLYVGQAKDLFKRWDGHATLAFTIYKKFQSVREILHANKSSPDIAMLFGKKPTLVDCMMAYAHFVKAPTALFIADKLKNTKWVGTKKINVIEWLDLATTPHKGFNMTNFVPKEMETFYTDWNGDSIPEAIDVLEQEWIDNLKTLAPERGLNMKLSVSEIRMKSFYDANKVEKGKWNI